MPPMLEGQKPLAQPETREPAAPKQTELGTAKTKAKTTAKAKAKTKAKADKKAQKKSAAKKATCKIPPKVVKKKSLKNQKTKPPEAAPTQQVGPEEG